MIEAIEDKRETLEDLAETDFDIDTDAEIHTADEIAAALLELDDETAG